MHRLADRLQIKEFRLIQSIQQTGQLALAAQNLSVTQPAASRMLASIEQKVGEQIFLRHPKGMVPTFVGEILVRKGNEILQSLEAAEREVYAVGRGLSGTVRIGAVTGGAVAFVVPAIKRLKKDTHGSDIHIDVGPSSTLIEGTINGDYDFVLSRIPPGTDPVQFSVQRARVEIVQFLVRSDHPLTGKGKLILPDLAGYEMVIQASHTPMRQAVEEAFVAQDVPLPVEIVNTTSLLVMIAYLEATDAITPISREVGDLLAPETMKRGWVALELKEPIIIKPYYLIYRKGTIMNPLAKRLHSLICASILERKS